MRTTFEGYTWIKFTKDCRWGRKGDVVELGPDQAAQMVEDGRGVKVEDPTASKSKTRKTKNKAMSAEA